MNYAKKQIAVVMSVMLATVAILCAVAVLNKDTAKAVTRAQAVTDTNGNTFTWAYTYDSTIQDAPATDVYLNGLVGDNATIKTDVIIPDSFTDENGVHKVQSIGKGTINGTDSFFVDCTVRVSCTLIDASNCTGLTTINGYAFNTRTNMLLRLPITVTNVKETVFRGGGGNVVYCENPNIIFEGADETSDDFVWVGPANSTANEFYGAKCKTSAEDAWGRTTSYSGPSTYKLTLDKNDDTKHPASMETGLRNDTVYVFADYAGLTDNHKAMTSLLSVPAREHFIFEGFYNGKTQILDKNGKIVVENVSALNGDTTLYAKWTPVKYTLSFNLDGAADKSNVFASVTKDFETIITLPKMVEREGYTFVRWDSADGKDSFSDNGSYQITQTTTLKAVWHEHTYKIAYDANGGVNGMPVTTPIAYSEEYTLAKCQFVKSGYSFKEWNTQADGSGTAYADQEIVKGLSSVHADTVTLYAIWTPNPYVISFDANGGSGSMSDVNATYDSPVTIPKNNFSKKGYSFEKWNTEPDGFGTAYNSFEDTKNLAEKGSITLYAIWTPIRYNLCYDPNGGEGDLMAQGLKYDSPGYVRSNEFTKTGHSFLGWSTEAVRPEDYKDKTKAEVESQYVKYRAGDEIINLRSSYDVVTLYAVWYPETYPIRFVIEATGFSIDKPCPLSYRYGDTIVLPVLKKAGYDFLGWEDKNGNIVKEIKATDVGSLSFSDKWEPTLHSIKYDFDGNVYINGTKVDKSFPIRCGKSISTIHVDVPNGNYITECSLVGEASKEILFTQSGFNTNAIDVTPDISMPDEDILLSIKTKECTYDISYDLSGGAMVNPAAFPGTHTYGQEVALPDGSAISKAGMNFAGWNVANTSEVISTIPANRIGDLKLIATWNLATYTLSIDPNGGDGPDEGTEADAPYEISFRYEETGVTLPTVTKDGHTFAGWYNITTGSFVDTIDTSLTQNQQVVAKWRANSSTAIEHVFDTGINYKKEVSLATELLSEPNNFYYNNLSDIEKRLYTTVYNEFKFDMNTGKCPTDSIKIVSDAEFTTNDICDAMAALVWEHPEMFWVRGFRDSFIKRTSNLWTCVVTPSKAYSENAYMADALEYKARYTELVNSLKEQGIASASVYNKLVMIYDEIAERYSYSANTKILNTKTTDETRAIGYLLSHKEGCCASYAKMMKVLCDEFGIPCAIVVGPEHMFNAVQIDGKWYLADATWDDQGDSAGKAYFLKGTNPLISEYHIITNNFFCDVNGNPITEYGYLPAPPIEQNAYPVPPAPPLRKQSKEVTKGNVVYRISGKSAVVVKAKKKKVKSVKILSKVKIGKKTYKVTKINKNAFKNCKKLKKITIQAKFLKSIGKYAFKGIAKKAVIKVPKAKQKSYRKLFKKSKIAKSVKIS